MYRYTWENLPFVFYMMDRIHDVSGIVFVVYKCDAGDPQASLCNTPFVLQKDIVIIKKHLENILFSEQSFHFFFFVLSFFSLCFV